MISLLIDLYIPTVCLCRKTIFVPRATSSHSAENVDEAER